MARSRGDAVRVPRHGYVFVTVTARDANGFVHRYDEIETPVASLHESLAMMHLKSTAMDAAQRDSATA